jgi:uncharacterized membrane protein YedE/YeeE
MGLFVPILLLLGNKQLGLTGSLRAICAAVAPGGVDFFRYDWRRSGLWNVALAAGILAGAAFAVIALDGGQTPLLSSRARDSVEMLGLSAPSGLVPRELFGWRSLLTLRGALCMLGGGFLVGFGSAYGGGCTSGHGVLGLATLQVASAVAVVGIFAGGILTTFLIVPHIL